LVVKAPSAAVIGARSRRQSSAAAGGVRWQWFTDQVTKNLSLTMRDRVRVATERLKSKIVKNISIGVTVGVGPKGGRVITNRSKPGEFPHAETAQLMRTVFSDIVGGRDGSTTGYVGTPLAYGLILETRMNRSFLVRTLLEESASLGLILAAPIRK